MGRTIFSALSVILSTVALPASSAVAADQDRRITVEHLLEEGWEITGYTGTADNRSSLMLFKHRDRKFLIQCAIFYDVTRAPRTNVNCYELH